MQHQNRVLFERPLLTELSESYTVVDMHFHSRHSDGFNDIPSIAGRARKLGIGVAVTDHNEIRGAIHLAQYEDIFSIPGIEITSREGAHLLVYLNDIKELIRFYETDLVPWLGRHVMSSSFLPMEGIIEKARKYKPVIIFPHPYCAVYTGICNPVISDHRQQYLLDQADGVEAINAGNLKKWNLQCAVLGFNLGKSMTGGSDGHNLFQMGKAVTCAEKEKAPDRRAFLEAVRQGQCRVIGKEIDLIRKVTSNGYKIKNNIMNYPQILEKNVRYSYTVLNQKSRQVRQSVQKKINGRTKQKG